MRLLLILLIQCILIQCIPAQDKTGSDARKNIIYVEGESILILSNASINYERILLQGLSIKGGIGMFNSVEPDECHVHWDKSKGPIWKLSLFLILGKYFEIGLGISSMTCTTCSIYRDSESRIWPIISLGFRTGNHRPEFIKVHFGSYGIGLGLGYAFH